MYPRKILAILIAIAFITPIYGNAAEVETPSGKATIGAVAKWMWGWSYKDEDTLNDGRDEYSTVLADITLDAQLTDKISFMIEIASSWNQDMATGSLGTFSGPDETGTTGVRQASITLDRMVPWTTIEIGTFIPPITNYMDRPVHDLDLILYPLIIDASNMDTGMYGNRPAARDFGLWQQTGVNFHIEAPYLVKIDLGLWDGTMPDSLGNEEQNLATATSVVFTFDPTKDLSISLAFWGEEFQPEGSLPGIADGAKRNLTTWFAYASYETDLLELNVDYAQALIPEAIEDTSGELQQLEWEAWQFTAGYWVVPSVQIIGRYESINPNMQDDTQIPSSRYDESTWFTLGANWAVTEHALVSANYIWKWENGRMIDEGDPGQDPTLPGYDPKYSAQNNDLLLVQVQVYQ